MHEVMDCGGRMRTITTAAGEGETNRGNFSLICRRNINRYLLR